jgi:hypothetical protein
MNYAFAALLVVGTIIAAVDAHGAMVTPAPRSSHSQTLDEHNQCGSSTPYSQVGMEKGEYCGLGCLGDSCLYYQIGCFQGCGSCSLQGKTLYPVPDDVTLAGCDPNKMPEPTLGGGNSTLAKMLRSYNIDGESSQGDWTKWMPWRSPGSAGKGNPAFQPCGVNSGALASQPEPPTTAHDVPNGGNGTDLPELPKKEWATWRAGSVVEAEWAIYANHAGGYSYRLCKKVPGQELTEECYQQGHMEFATPETEIRYKDGSRAPFNITSITTNVGTWPVGSQWRKNPVPMCNCDIGTGCSAAQEETEAMVTELSPIDEAELGNFQCKSDATCGSPDKVLGDCKKCSADGKSPAWSCDECCEGWTKVTKAGGGYCTKGKGPSPSPSPKPRGGMFQAYKSTHFHAGQTSKLCPSGVQFPTYWDEGAGAGTFDGGFGRFMFTMVDKLKVPDVPAGDYSVSWRWDCEETPQVWNSCADVTITK